MPGKVLVIEDSKLLHKVYQMAFKRHAAQGWELLYADNGRAGLDLLERNGDVVLILLDINMPVMSGLEFLSCMMAQPALRDIPVLIISTEGDEHDVIRGLEAGARAYLTKPFTTDDLFGVIRRILPDAGLAASN